MPVHQSVASRPIPLLGLIPTLSRPNADSDYRVPVFMYIHGLKQELRARRQMRVNYIHCLR